MLYFAYGSNLHHKQMKKRCKESKYLKCYILKNYKLSFRTNNYSGGVIDGGVADIQKKKKKQSSGGNLQNKQERRKKARCL